MSTSSSLANGNEDSSAGATSFRPLTPESRASLEEDVVVALKTCYDPEIPVDVYELGLIYDIEIDKERFVTIRMTLTSPGCPVAGSLPPEVERKVAQVEGVLGAKVELVWEPPWTMDCMSEEAKLELGFF
ncbi:MAG: SUF system Fe-S cluster assembly protein [Capsulimonadaceae bacterium]|nr:SUF system Fe-S cluster assembly protein [Capsulimonadaceae bacterium]